MWCWEQPLGQPLILMWICLVSGSVMFISSSRFWSTWLRPIEAVIPSLQLSVPGQLTTSVTLKAPASPSSSSSRRTQRS